MNDLYASTAVWYFLETLGLLAVSYECRRVNGAALTGPSADTARNGPSPKCEDRIAISKGSD